MARYIDADALMRQNLTFLWNDSTDQPLFEYIIEKTPTADVVEVVRCKYCVFAQLMKDEKTLVCMRQSSYKRPEDYCSYGKEWTGKEYL